MARSMKTAKIFKAVKDGSKIAVWDLETTGLDNNHDEETQITLILCQLTGGKMVELDRFNTYVKPHVPVNPEAAAVTGITDEFLADKPDETEIFPKVKELFDAADYICGHNIIAFDIKFMAKIYERCGYPDGFNFTEEQMLDTLVACRDIVPKEQAPLDDKGKHSHRLQYMVDYFNVEVEGEFHDALTDVKSCVGLCEKLLKEYEDYNTDEQWSNPNIVPVVKKVTPWMGKFPNAYQKANYLFVDTDCGRWKFNRFSLKWDEIERAVPVSLDAVIKATYEFCGVDNEGDLAHWSPNGTKEPSAPLEIPENPGDFVIPFGKNKDKKVSEVDKDSLEWYAGENFSPNTDKAKVFKEAVIQYLATI